MADGRRLLGRIVRLQIQRSPLKVGEKPNRHYDPAALLAVERLTLTVRGAVAQAADGATLLDVHHMDHPQSRHVGDNALSVGFTGHYALMRERFGEQVVLGCAGETIIVAAGDRQLLESMAAGLEIETQAGRRLRLAGARVAEPCRPFTGYLLQKRVEAEVLKAALQFLEGGTRGFYFTLAEHEPAAIAVGDPVFVLA